MWVQRQLLGGYPSQFYPRGLQEKQTLWLLKLQHKGQKHSHPNFHHHSGRKLRLAQGKYLDLKEHILLNKIFTKCLFPGSNARYHSTHSPWRGLGGTGILVNSFISRTLNREKESEAEHIMRRPWQNSTLTSSCAGMSIDVTVPNGFLH